MSGARTSALFATLPLDPRSSAPLYRQLYDGVRDAILRGHLRPGTRLPSTRALADNLSLSRTTVLLAYEQLLAEGYVEGKAGSGTYVSRALPDELVCAPAAGPKPVQNGRRSALLADRGGLLSAGPESMARHPRPVHPFQTGLPALDAFPFATWARLTARGWRTLPRGLLGYDHPAGCRALREAIANYLGTARAVQCSSDQVIVVSGSLRALDLVTRLLLDPGDAVWVEDPGYPGARNMLLAAGARLIPVPVDSEGMNVLAGVARGAGAKMAYVTPSHQCPLGMTMSLARRLALLEWASNRGAWIIEDDYDSEFRYAGRPLPSLQSLDQQGRVIYLGSFSKVLFPALRLGYMVVPSALVDACITALAVIDGPPRSVDQAVLADFMTEGHFVRHLRRMRTLYAERQELLLKAVTRELGGLLDVQPAEGGMYVIGSLPNGVDDEVAQGAAAAEGVVAVPLSPFGYEPGQSSGLLLGFSAYDGRQIREGVRRLAVALRKLRPGAKG